MNAICLILDDKGKLCTIVSSETWTHKGGWKRDYFVLEDSDGLLLRHAGEPYKERKVLT